MPKIEFPKPLKDLLEESDLQAPIRALADRVGEILSDNKLPFFPDYTDHGIEHINCVLASEVELVPKQVWESSKSSSNQRLLCDADAAVIIGATLLHDIAMHLRPDGFRELVSKDSRFQPLPWFNESHEGQPADIPWQELWENYIREARRFSDRDLTDIIGEESARVWKFHDLPKDAGQWERNHCLIIGEFIRRHHARLAHEISIYGFPGLPLGSGESNFPAMGKEEGHSLMRLADLIGLTARSHGISLRVCKSYLESSPLYPGTPRPMGTAVFYPMSLLRVADFLQIDRQRAPAVLLQLRNPQSPVSVQEWKKHRAVQYIGPATDPLGKMVTVSHDLSLTLFLQLHDLLQGLQAEMDHSTAVLDEAYGTRTELGLNQLNLAIRRVYSNLQSSAFRDSLPYIPKRTGFTADPNLLTLLVEPLYGKKPSVGVRELMQNAVDAVSELEAWCAAHGKRVKSLELPRQKGDVLIEFIEREKGTWYIRVRDKGIGMRHDTIQNYFLRAGASFRRSAEWTREFLDERGKPRVTRAGRFGIGAFAVFLLGQSFRLWTRHVSADNSMGYMIEASSNSQLIEIRRIDGLPIGTTIEVDMSSESVKFFGLEEKKYTDYFGPQHKIDWFCWDWPIVEKRVVRNHKNKFIGQKYILPIRKDKLPPELAVIHPDGFDAVYWTFGDMPTISCNGLRVADPDYSLFDSRFDWPEETQLQSPCIAVIDNAANLPLTTQRYKLSQDTVPFIDELARDVTLSFIAHALVCGPASRSEALSSLTCVHPLTAQTCTVYEEDNGTFSLKAIDNLLQWCVTPTEIIPADPWLYSLLNADSCFVFGVLSHKNIDSFNFEPLQKVIIAQTEMTNHAVYSYYGILKHGDGNNLIHRQSEKISYISEQMLANLARKGVSILGHDVIESQVVASVSKGFYLDSSSRVVFYQFPKSTKVVERVIWRESQASTPRRRWFEGKTGSFVPHIPIEVMLNVFESSLQIDNELSPNWVNTSYPEYFYVAEIRSKKKKRTPESLIAKIWNECLGAKAIPFDTAKRKALIVEGCKHPELRRHIKAWQEMKLTGSKWLGTI